MTPDALHSVIVKKPVSEALAVEASRKLDALELHLALRMNQLQERGRAAFTPDEVLAFARQTATDPEALLALMGYLPDRDGHPWPVLSLARPPVLLDCQRPRQLLAFYCWRWCLPDPLREIPLVAIAWAERPDQLLAPSPIN